MVTRKDLIQDLTYLHETTGLSNEELDESVLVLFNRSSSVSQNELEANRINLFLEYIRAVILKIENNLLSLRRFFAETKELNEWLSVCFRELHKLDLSLELNSQTKKIIFTKIKNLFSKVNKLGDAVLDNGDYLATERF